LLAGASCYFIVLNDTPTPRLADDFVYDWVRSLNRARNKRRPSEPIRKAYREAIFTDDLEDLLEARPDPLTAYIQEKLEN
jgi:hypothetical protein